ncbi:MAG: hypothetical protein QXR71_03155 [Candidatus Aenigmatarchaeota archaeon]
MKRFGYTKGSLTMAAREAISKWLETKKSEKEIEEFKKILKGASGFWSKESGYRYIRKLRIEDEKRAKRLCI